MLIPDIMSEAMASVFYDKEVEILGKEVVTDSEGGTTVKGYNVTGAFRGNVSYSNCKKIQEEYGLDYDIDVAITTFRDVEVNIDDLIKYDGVVFSITDKLLSDSHALIVAKKWR